MIDKKKRIEAYKALIELNGVNHQVAVAVGELGELLNELAKQLRGSGRLMKMCEEIADVKICIEQLELIFDEMGDRVPLFMDFKLRRLNQFNIKEKAK